MDNPRPQVTPWEKLGVVFAPSGDRPWMRSHASLPLPLHVGGDVYRVFFASRDEANRSSICALTLELRPIVKVLSIDARPVLSPGPLGHFDDHGVYPASLVRDGSRLLLYYIGWNPGAKDSLFYSSIGVAVGDLAGQQFVRVSPAPIMARSEWDPCLVTSPCVLVDDGSWRMWYVSGFRWSETPSGLQSYYHVKYAYSTDGLTWHRDGHVCIDLQGSERNIGRPCVARDDDGYKMWYCVDAGQGYRLGYAQSNDGLRWRRLDGHVGIAPSANGWDSEAQAYPWVFTHGGARYMLYNGNRFGKSGFGLAVQACN